MDAREMKIKAAAEALTHVEDGMRLGIGTGSTAEEFVRLLAERVAGGLKVEGVPTSERTARSASNSACNCARSTSCPSSISRSTAPTKSTRSCG